MANIIFGDMNMHPDWYFEYYNDVFGHFRNYSKEVNLINSIFDIKDSKILEIGGGTGNHCNEFLKFDPDIVVEVDVEPKAVSLMRKRFEGSSRVVVLQGDGFNVKYGKKFDLIVIMFSVMQQCDFSVIARRFLKLKAVMNEKGCIIFEWIDSEKLYKKVNGEKPIVAYEKNEDKVVLKTVFHESLYRMMFFGKIDGHRVKYSVDIASVTKEQLEVYADEIGMRIRFFDFLGSTHKKIVVLS